MVDDYVYLSINGNYKNITNQFCFFIDKYIADGKAMHKIINHKIFKCNTIEILKYEPNSFNAIAIKTQDNISIFGRFNFFI
jgi:hypothetical protein